MVFRLSDTGALKAIKHIFKKPATTKYPFVKPELCENYRGEPLFDYELCIGCSLCAKNCPSKAIDMIEVDGKKRPQYRMDKCIFCNTCVDVCPKKAVKRSALFEHATLDKSKLTKKPPSVKKEVKS
ncbi:MAG: 4Fe-4S binding protein [Candidatus Bathyarchaeia archaeon]|jgi:formate hydrogenlyase subunit 6/NADH:ubiquinone oxidoreductase subunit I